MRKKVKPIETNDQWMPIQQWKSLTKGENCPLCSALKSTIEMDDFGITVAVFKSGKLRLLRNQYVLGYCIFISNTHVQEPYQLAVTQRQDFFEDMMKIGQVLEHVYSPIKMNFTLLGNSIPHLHAHIIPRYYGDDAPNNPIDPTNKEILLTNLQLEKQAATILSTLELYLENS